MKMETVIQMWLLLWSYSQIDQTNVINVTKEQ